MSETKSCLVAKSCLTLCDPMDKYLIGLPRRLSGQKLCLPIQETDEPKSSVPESERSPGEGNGNQLQYSCLENSMDRGD